MKIMYMENNIVTIPLKIDFSNFPICEAQNSCYDIITPRLTKLTFYIEEIVCYINKVHVKINVTIYCFVRLCLFVT